MVIMKVRPVLLFDKSRSLTSITIVTESIKGADRPKKRNNLLIRNPSSLTVTVIFINRWGTRQFLMMILTSLNHPWCGEHRICQVIPLESPLYQLIWMHLHCNHYKIVTANIILNVISGLVICGGNETEIGMLIINWEHGIRVNSRWFCRSTIVLPCYLLLDCTMLFCKETSLFSFPR